MDSLAKSGRENSLARTPGRPIDAVHVGYEASGGLMQLCDISSPALLAAGGWIHGPSGLVRAT